MQVEVDSQARVMILLQPTEALQLKDVLAQQTIAECDEDAAVTIYNLYRALKEIFHGKISG